ncbi:MAG: transposase [Chloroflexi bacterium]|nr:transposase [Chloroflexota bacterium]
MIWDKGYDAEAFVARIHERGAEAVIPPRSNRKTPRGYDAHLYKERHLIECLFNKMKYYRRVFSRFDKLAISYLGFVHFVATLILLR